MSTLGKLFAKTPVPYTPKTSGRSGVRTMFGQAPANHGTLEALEAYGNVGTLYAIVNRLAESTASNEWCLYQKPTNAKARKEQREFDERKMADENHPAMKLLAQPNPYADHFDFVQTVQQHLDLTGEAWIVLKYKTGPKGGDLRNLGPSEMWTMRPDRVTVKKDHDNFLVGYEYTLGEEKVPLNKDEVIQLKMPSPIDPYRGQGPVQAIMTDLDSQKYAAEFNRNFFINSAEPGGIIEVEERLDDDEFRELAMRWREQHQGVANAHRVAILEQGKWVDRRYSMQDMAFVDLSNLNQEKIREAFGYPKAMLGGTEDVNKAVMEASERMYSKWLIDPRLRRIRSALNSKLLPLFGSSGKGVEFDFADPVPADRQADSQERFTKAQAVNLMVMAGFDADETCDAFGLPRIKWTKPEPAAPKGPDGEKSGQRPGPNGGKPDEAGGSKKPKEGAK